MKLMQSAIKIAIGLAASLLLSAPASAKWFRAESEHFIVYGGNENELRKDVERLEQFDFMLRTLTRIPSETKEAKLSVYMVRDIDLVNSLHGGKSNSVAGFYVANPSGALAVVPRQTYDDFEDVVLFHEYAHHVMLKYFPAAYPAWYVEGFAEYLSTVTFEKGVAKIGLPANHRAYGLYAEDPVPIERLLSANVADLTDREGDKFYGRSWLLVHYLTFAPERDGSQRKYLNLINAGTAPIEAAKQAFGDLKKLNFNLNTYQRNNRFPALAYKMNKQPSVITITPIDDALGDAMNDRIRLSRGTAESEREPIAARLQAQVAKTPGNAGLLTLLAEAELDLKKNEAAIAATDKALASDPAIARALLWKGLAKMHILLDEKSQDTNKWKEARSWIIKANNADTEDALALYTYYTIFGMQGREAPAVAIDGLAKAVELLPQVGGFRISFANELARKGDYESAKIAVQPIANSPHGGDLAKRAQLFMQAMDVALQKGERPVNAAQIWADPPKPEDGKGGEPGK